MKLGPFPLRCCDAHTHAVVTHLSTPLFPSQDSGLSSVPLPCAWNKVVFGEEGVFPDLTEVCVGFGFFQSVVFSGRQTVYFCGFQPTSSQVQLHLSPTLFHF